MLSRTHWTGASQTVLGVQAGQLALTRRTQFCWEGGREVWLLQQVVHTTMSPVVFSRRNLEHICRKNTLKGSARIRTCTQTCTHVLARSLTTHQVVQLNVGKGFYDSLGGKCGSITEEHGLKGDQRTV